VLVHSAGLCHACRSSVERRIDERAEWFERGQSRSAHQEPRAGASATADDRLSAISGAAVRSRASRGLASAAPYLAVIDTDLQHDETILPEMMRRLRHSDLDIVIGSRFAAGGNVDGCLSPRRLWLSRLRRRSVA
jgi:hypothetical protein